MHHEDLSSWQHDHDFIGDQGSSERRTRWVIAITFLMMVAELGAGYVFGSMALLADGWHMASHTGALGISAFAYWYGRRHRHSGQYAFGPAKVNALSGFASGLLLVVVAALMLFESVERWMVPVTIRFDEAIIVAILGLLVNVASAVLLSGGRHHHDHDHDHHHDHNLRAAYLHVLADALTSILAILALLAGRFAGWNWMDPLMGVLGAILIIRWSVGLLRATSRILLDASIPKAKLAQIREAVEGVGDSRIADLHAWRLTEACYAVTLSVVTHDDTEPAIYRARVAKLPHIAHITVEVNRCCEAA